MGRLISVVRYTHCYIPEPAGATVDLMRQYSHFRSAGVSIISFGKVSHLTSRSVPTQWFSQCCNVPIPDGRRCLS